jgi:hypothetical protein
LNLSKISKRINIYNSERKKERPPNLRAHEVMKHPISDVKRQVCPSIPP